MAEQKKKVAILFGGKSGEHEVSITSALSVFKALDKNKYDVTLMAIDKSGRWVLPSRERALSHAENPRKFDLSQEKEEILLVPYESDRHWLRVNPSKSNSDAESVPLKFDVIMPILHGTYGEDGTVQGLLELSNIPYVGSGVLGSGIGMDKDVARRLLRAGGVPVVETLVVRKHEYTRDKENVLREAMERFGFPFFVKPANAGSSVGVHKVKNQGEAFKKMDNAFLYDNKILIEQAVEARELECSVLGNEEPKASIVGEIIPQHEFYSYEAKYLDENGALLQIPAKDVSASLADQIRELSIRAFRILECSGLARVDFFLDKKSGQLYLNEINTLPGFTKISMYPKLWEATGLVYPRLLDELIDLALARHAQKNALKTSFEPEPV
jgi:D-alanine-D-alanine ligase